MEFNHLNQPDFDRNRDGAVKDVVEDNWWRGGLALVTELCKQSYNEGYKQALRDWSIWKDGVQHIGCMQHDIKEIIAEVDKIDGEA